MSKTERSLSICRLFSHVLADAGISQSGLGQRPQMAIYIHLLSLNKNKSGK